MTSPRRLLLDLDGTLTASPETLLALRFTWRTASRLKDHGLGGWARALRALRAVKLAFEAPPSASDTPPLTNDVRAVRALAQELGVPEPEAKRLLAENATEFLKQERASFRPVPGAADFIEWARVRYPLTLATNPIWLRPEVELRVRWGGIDPKLFEHITTADRMTACKPHPLYYREILASYPELQPKDALMIGNSPITDLAATRVGIPVFLLSNQSRPEKLRSPGIQAPAWTGNFSALRDLLSANRHLDEWPAFEKR